MTEWETSFPIPSSDSLLSHVEQLLRAFILKISVCDAVLDHNPPGVMPRSPLLPALNTREFISPGLILLHFRLPLTLSLPLATLCILWVALPSQ